MSELKDWQTDHLILIVGMNPLPNLVAARLLAPENVKLLLVVTAEVKALGIPRRLLEILKRDPSDESQYIPVDSASPEDIFERVTKRVEGLDGSVGLHYTGGKKSMATHTYRAVESILAGTRKKVVYSYLDADTLCLVLNREGGGSTSDFVRDLAPVSIEEILKLHGRSLKGMQQVPLKPDFCTGLVTYCQVPEQRQKWLEWARTSLKANNKSLNTTQTQEILVPGDFPQIGGYTLGDIASQWNTKASTLADWLHGKWLDEYVFEQARQAAHAASLTEFAFSVQPQGINDFEVDVVAMQGYRMFAIAVTTDDEKGLAKLKLFEALTRAHQMGGDEARTALVCFSTQTQKLARQVGELLTFTDGSTKEVSQARIFGITHLPGLAAELENWFKEV